MATENDPVKDANRALDVLMTMCGDLPVRLGELSDEQLEALVMAQRGAGHMLENKPGLRPAFDAAMFLWGIVGAEGTRRVHRDEAESRELERVFGLEAETE